MSDLNNVDIGDLTSAVEAHNSSNGQRMQPIQTNTEASSQTVEAETNTQTEVTESEPEDGEGADTQDYTHQPVPTTQTETTTEEPSQSTEEAKAESTTEIAKPEAQVDWKSTLPPAPQPYQGPRPEYDDTGQITNMTPQQFAQYIEASSAADANVRGYTNLVENRSLDAAEQVLPEMKSNPAIRELVSNTRVASLLNGGDPIDFYDAALRVREVLGLGTERLAQARSEGAQSQRSSIEVQKRSAIEHNGSSQPIEQSDRTTQAFEKRLRQGDENAMVELMDIFLQDGKI